MQFSSMRAINHFKLLHNSSQRYITITKCYCTTDSTVFYDIKYQGENVVLLVASNMPTHYNCNVTQILNCKVAGRCCCAYHTEIYTDDRSQVPVILPTPIWILNAIKLTILLNGRNRRGGTFLQGRASTTSCARCELH